jgi:ABC-type transporter Mla MlaB component
MNDAHPSSPPKAAKRSRRKASATPVADAGTGNASLALPADVGIEETGALRTLLADHLDDADVTLDGSQVQRIHTSAMQLFLMFCRDRVAAGRSTVWHDPSAPLHAAARVLGLTHALQFPRELS